MTERAELLREIDQLPPQYVGEVFDFVGYLRKKTQGENDGDIEAYKAMAADTEREQEAREWCNAYFGPACAQ
jgi:molybdopterin synthase catalytic subunit